MEQDSGFDPATRRLCPDGTCIGVLDASGVCGECGRKFEGAAVTRPSDSLGYVPVVEVEAPAVQETPGAGFDPNRRLCDDGTCVGVIAANGMCTVCGRMAG